MTKECRRSGPTIETVPDAPLALDIWGWGGGLEFLLIVICFVFCKAVGLDDDLFR